MAMALRLVGGLMMVYAVLYTFQLLFDQLYDDPGRVWEVMNYISALAILIALAANLVYARARSSATESASRTRLATDILCYATAALAIGFFHNWIDLFALDSGESVSIHDEVLWNIIGVALPLVLGATGWRLWQRST